LPQEFLLFVCRFGCCASALLPGPPAFFLYQLISAISIRLRAEKLLFWKSALAAGEIIYFASALSQSDGISPPCLEFCGCCWCLVEKST
jgi:hypothetical protein